MHNTPQIPVFYFHSVAPEKNPEWIKGFLTLDLRFLESFFKFLKNKGFETISLQDYYQIRKSNLGFSKKYVCLTFDDGYADNWIYVYPMVKKFGFKATIFVSPECVDPGNGMRKNLDDYWSGDVGQKEIYQSGYLRWDEMNAMVESGVIDIQSHTMTHTNYFISDKLIGFHSSLNTNIYPIWNLDISKKWNYVSDQGFMKKMPFGYPLFEEGYAVTARKITINDSFKEEVIQILNKTFKGSDYQFKIWYEKIKPVYDRYKKENLLVVHRETEDEYRQRLDYELIESKRIIEEKLNNNVEFLCWPHGGNDEDTHERALQVGYLATTKGKCEAASKYDASRITRIGFGAARNSFMLSNMKALYRLRNYQEIFPYNWIAKLYKIVK